MIGIKAARTRHSLAIVRLSIAGTLLTADAAPQTQTLAITRVAVVDVVTGRVVPDSTVTITGKTVSSVVPNGAPPRTAHVVDGHGKFLIPGLWDMHAHMEASGEAWLPLYVANGVTAIRDMGSALDLILTMREKTASAGVLGPRIFAAGPILDDPPGDWPFRMRVKSAADGTAAVQLLTRRGVDLIKVHNHTPRDVYFAIAAEARRQGLPLAGHVPTQVSIDEAIEAGQNDIEHFSESRVWMQCSGGDVYRPEPCRARFAMLASRRIWQTPTIVALSELATIGTPASSFGADRMAYATRAMRAMWAGNQRMFATPEVVRLLKRRAETTARVAADVASAGGGILVGCDTMIAGFCVHDEMSALVRGGMTPLAALQAATLNPARYFGLSQTAGSVAPGRSADLVLLDANPLDDIENVRRIQAVVSAGRLLDRKALDTLLAEARSAASVSSP